MSEAAVQQAKRQCPGCSLTKEIWYPLIRGLFWCPTRLARITERDLEGDFVAGRISATAYQWALEQRQTLPSSASDDVHTAVRERPPAASDAGASPRRPLVRLRLRRPRPDDPSYASAT